jgi:2-keto-4-pentenoate hydratase
MIDERRTAEAARFLLEEHRAHKPFGPIPDVFTPRTVEEAYVVQEAFGALMQSARGAVGGYKVALTTPVMQRMIGFDEPVAGVILEKTIQRSPGAARAGDYGRLGVECEIAVQLAADLPLTQVPYRRDDVAQAVGAVMTAFELIDDRGADYSKIPPRVFIADNAWNAGVVLGAGARDWRSLDLAAARGEMVVNGAVVAEGHGRDVMGHPFEALAWLANALAKRGKKLARGMYVMTGSIVTTKFLQSDDSASFTLAGLGEVKLRVA